MRRRLIADGERAKAKKKHRSRQAESKRKTNLSWQLISQEMTPADREAVSDQCSVPGFQGTHSHTAD